MDGMADVGEGGGVLVVDFVAGGGVVFGPELDFFDEGVHGCRVVDLCLQMLWVDVILGCKNGVNADAAMLSILSILSLQLMINAIGLSLYSN